VLPAIELSRYPALAKYLENMRKRPSVATAIAEEATMWRAELARHAAV
jgi:glutathione S-transferase